jgi:hypothetical protein
VSEPKPKPFEISKRAVGGAWLRVKANRGAAGVDEQSLCEFERDLEGGPLQALEAALVGELFPAAGARGGDTEARRRLEGARGADGHRIRRRRPASLWVRWSSRIRSIRFAVSGSRFCLSAAAAAGASMSVRADRSAA